jgi:hypothetical protein
MGQYSRHFHILLLQCMRAVVNVLFEKIAKAGIRSNADGVKRGESKRLGSSAYLHELRMVHRHTQIVRVRNVIFIFGLTLLPRTLALQLNDRIPRVPNA